MANPNRPCKNKRYNRLRAQQHGREKLNLAMSPFYLWIADESL